MNTDDLMDVEQAAQRLGVTVRWVRRAIAQRRLPFIKMGHYVRFDPADLDDYIEQCRVETNRPAHTGVWNPPGYSTRP